MIIEATDYIKLPLSKYAETWNYLTADDQRQLAKDLSWLAQQCAVAGRYCDSRDCGLSHSRAVKDANRVLIKLRKALGYAYPDAGITPF